MAHRHKVQAFATGGGVEPHDPPVTTAYAGGSSNVVKEAHARKKGGRVHEEEYNQGGAVQKPAAKPRRKFGGPIAGAKTASRADRPGRKRGGGVGADTSPLSSAAHYTDQKLAEQH